jgi:hypothetical protein
MTLRLGENEGKSAEFQLPPHQGAALFAKRSRARGFQGLLTIIEREINDIKEAPEAVLVARYLDPLEYVQGLLSSMPDAPYSPYNQQDALVINGGIRKAVHERAKALGIATDQAE